MLGSRVASRTSWVAAGLAGTLVIASPASATLIGTVSFTTPTGIVGPTDPVDVYLTLSLDESSDDLITDENGYFLSGLNSQDYEDAGFDSSQVAHAYMNVFLECSGTFTAVCTDGPPYDFDFAFDTHNLNIAAGGSATLLYGTFTPTAGFVLPGTYTFYNAGITATPVDEDYNYFPDPTYGYPRSFTLFQTCPGQNDDCAFTRTVEGVAPVPEPSTWALMLAGFGAVGYSLRRRTVKFAPRQLV